jgi:hypothetical protein
MPFVIRLHSCNVEPDAAERPDPLTGLPVPVAVVGGLTAAEKEAVLARLRSSGGLGPDGLGRFKVCFPDGRVAQAEFPNLTGAGRCASGTLTAAEPFPGLVRLAYELARDGNMLLLPDGVPRPLAPTAAQLLHVVRKWPAAVTVPSAAHLWALFAPPPKEAEETTSVESDDAAGDPDSVEATADPPDDP